jgi:hypothetical protein
VEAAHVVDGGTSQARGGGATGGGHRAPQGERLLTIPGVARIARWHGRAGVRRMRRLLRRLHISHGQLLVDVGVPGRPRFLCSLDALQRLFPEWFGDGGALGARVAELEERMDDVEASQEKIARRVGDVARHMSTKKGEAA